MTVYQWQCHVLVYEACWLVLPYKQISRPPLLCPMQSLYRHKPTCAFPKHIHQVASYSWNLTIVPFEKWFLPGNKAEILKVQQVVIGQAPITELGQTLQNAQHSTQKPIKQPRWRLEARTPWKSVYRWYQEEGGFLAYYATDAWKHKLLSKNADKMDLRGWWKLAKMLRPSQFMTAKRP